MSEENQGLPCPDCGKKMKRLQIDRAPDGLGVNVRINWFWTKAEAKAQLKGLVSLLRSFVDGL